VLAHKYWPKGFPHGDKEDWELSKWALRAKHKRAEAKRDREAARRGHASSSGGRRRSGDGFGDEEYYHDPSYGYPERELPRGRAPTTGAYHTSDRVPGERVEVEEYAYGYTADGGRGSAASRRGRNSRSRDRGCTPDRYAPACRRASSRERTTTERYYPPAPRRYFLERSDSAAGSSSAASNGSRYFAERRTSVTGSGAAAVPQLRYHDEGWPGEVVYLRRDPVGRSRRASFDAGAVGRRERGYEWDY
jgi:hypothetical protein